MISLKSVKKLVREQKTCWQSTGHRALCLCISFWGLSVFKVLHVPFQQYLYFKYLLNNCTLYLNIFERYILLYCLKIFFKYKHNLFKLLLNDCTFVSNVFWIYVQFFEYFVLGTAKLKWFVTTNVTWPTDLPDRPFQPVIMKSVNCFTLNI